MEVGCLDMMVMDLMEDLNQFWTIVCGMFPNFSLNTLNSDSSKMETITTSMQWQSMRLTAYLIPWIFLSTIKSLLKFSSSIFHNNGSVVKTKDGLFFNIPKRGSSGNGSGVSIAAMEAAFFFFETGLEGSLSLEESFCSWLDNWSFSTSSAANNYYYIKNLKILAFRVSLAFWLHSINLALYTHIGEVWKSLLSNLFGSEAFLKAILNNFFFFWGPVMVLYFGHLTNVEDSRVVKMWDDCTNRGVCGLWSLKIMRKELKIGRYLHFESCQSQSCTTTNSGAEQRTKQNRCKTHQNRCKTHQNSVQNASPRCKTHRAEFLWWLPLFAPAKRDSDSMSEYFIERKIFVTVCSCQKEK